MTAVLLEETMLQTPCAMAVSQKAVTPRTALFFAFSLLSAALNPLQRSDDRVP